jgi:hypothetical protein
VVIEPLYLLNAIRVHIEQRSNGLFYATSETVYRTAAAETEEQYVIAAPLMLHCLLATSQNEEGGTRH